MLDNVAMKHSRWPKVVLIVLYIFFSSNNLALSQPRNVILFIGDGMGFEQIKAAGIYTNGVEGSPTVSWSTTGHTAKDVPLYSWGENAELVFGLMDNTDIFYVATAETTSSTVGLDGERERQNGCFIATAYGSQFTSQVRILRNFRNRFWPPVILGMILSRYIINILQQSQK